MSFFNSKFDINRNKWRRVYNYGGTKPPPANVQYFDVLTGLTKQRDFNQIIRDRDMYLVGIMETYPFSFAEYQEAEVNLSNTDTYTVVFSSAFSNTPIVTLQIDTGSNTNTVGFINYYLLTYTIWLHAGS